MRSRALAGAALVGALAVGACSGGDGTDTGATDDTSAPASPERFTGSTDDFYVLPDPLPEGRPGDLIRVQTVAEYGDTTTLRIMYHSNDAQDRDRAVTGLVTYPTAEPPADGWPVVSWAHGTSALAAKCAPSRTGLAAPDFGVEGVHVGTDYVGLGPVGERHPYLSGPSGGNSVIDAVRAARQIPETNAGARWLAVGHSRGGHAAQFAAEMSAERAPDLELLGTVSIAPAAVLDQTFGPDDEVIPRVVEMMGLYGLAEDFPEIDPYLYVTDAVAAVDDVIDTGCTQEIAAAFLAIPPDQIYRRDPQSTEPARTAILANDPGWVRSDAPMLVVHSTADVYVVPERVDVLMEHLCLVGQVTQVRSVDRASHQLVTQVAEPLVGAWLEDRIAGRAPVDDCPPEGSTAPSG